VSLFAEWRARYHGWSVIERVLRRDEGRCQFWGHVWDAAFAYHDLNDAPEVCSPMLKVLNLRPDLSLDELHCTTICVHHVDWLVNRPDVALALGVAYQEGTH
jgi:hypothetical protein